MHRLIITRGVQGSGKTTRAKAWVAQDTAGRVRVNRDSLRTMLHGGWLGTAGQEQAVTEVQENAVRQLLRGFFDVVVDDTNLPARTARRWATLAREEDAEFTVWDLSDVPLDVCLARNAQRTGGERIPEDVIRDRYAKFIVPLHGRGFPTVEPAAVSAVGLGWVRPYVQPDPGVVPDAVLVDLDGTVAGMSGRSPYEWHRVGEDTVVEPVQRAVLAAARDGLDIIFMSGRDEVCRPETEKWLREHFGELVVPVLNAPILFMRPAGDMRKDSLVKHELFDQNVRDRWRIAYVFDDRQQVVDMWRRMGLTVFQVAEGNF